MASLPKLRLLMAVSADDFVCTGPYDDMKWTGTTDKQVFRLLTSVGGVVGAGSRTFDQMPQLPGRQLVRLTTQPRTSGALEEMTLGRFAHLHPGAWIIGGQTVAMEALETGLVGSAHISHVLARLGTGVKDAVSRWLRVHDWRTGRAIAFGDTLVRTWSAPR